MNKARMNNARRNAIYVEQFVKRLPPLEFRPGGRAIGAIYQIIGEFKVKRVRGPTGYVAHMTDSEKAQLLTLLLCRRHVDEVASGK